MWRENIRVSVKDISRPQSNVDFGLKVGRNQSALAGEEGWGQDRGEGCVSGCWGKNVEGAS